MQNSKILTSLIIIVWVAIIGCSTNKPKIEPATEVTMTKEVMAEKKEATIPEIPKSETLIKIEDLLSELMAEKVYFDFDKSELTEKAKEILAKVGQILSKPLEKEEIHILIEGHTDETGAEEYNIALGGNRAVKVKEYLESYGVKPALIKFVSYGEEMKAQQGKTEQDHAMNRRAEIKAESVPLQ